MPVNFSVKPAKTAIRNVPVDQLQRSLAIAEASGIATGVSSDDRAHPFDYPRDSMGRIKVRFDKEGNPVVNPTAKKTMAMAAQQYLDHALTLANDQDELDLVDEELKGKVADILAKDATIRPELEKTSRMEALKSLQAADQAIRDAAKAAAIPAKTPVTA